eukprot:gnl/MRDRNA2_/MRDRNA2_36457_c0_seq1.p1 gnl/MRDRNA2_/MRDRNA2_36457_c0~~gnl/MRDRNA2_/MRDRNA2_36457_c0_seq1.p1  ORF type:complete len:982 (+),score=123.89 gnl/MRDRNA2_/MRDRNA2_36457_c0_seq1:139-2946(+)
MAACKSGSKHAFQIQEWFGRAGNNMWQIQTAILVAEAVDLKYVQLPPDGPVRQLFDLPQFLPVGKAVSNVARKQHCDLEDDAGRYKEGNFDCKYSWYTRCKSTFAERDAAYVDILGPYLRRDVIDACEAPTEGTLTIHMRSGDKALSIPGVSGWKGGGQPPCAFFHTVIDTGFNGGPFKELQLVYDSEAKEKNLCVEDIIRKHKDKTIHFPAGPIHFDACRVVKAKNLALAPSSLSTTLVHFAKDVKRLFHAKLEPPPCHRNYEDHFWSTGHQKDTEWVHGELAPWNFDFTELGEVCQRFPQTTFFSLPTLPQTLRTNIPKYFLETKQDELIRASCSSLPSRCSASPTKLATAGSNRHRVNCRTAKSVDVNEQPGHATSIDHHYERIWDYVFAVAFTMWFLRSCYCLHRKASHGAMFTFMCVAILFCWLASYVTPLGSNIIYTCHFVALFKWGLHCWHGQDLSHYACNGVKEQFAFSILLAMLANKRWVFDTHWEHPYDPVLPIMSNPAIIRMWQQCFFVIVWAGLVTLLLQNMMPAISLKDEYKSVSASVFNYHLPQVNLPALEVVVLGMPLLYMSDLMMWNVTILGSYFGLAALAMKRSHQEFPTLSYWRAMVGFIVLFSGLNKICKTTLQWGAAWMFHKTLAARAPGLNDFIDSPEASFAMGVTVVITEVGFASLLLLGRGLCMRLAAVVLCMMHSTVLLLWLFMPGFGGSLMVSPNFAYPMILMAIVVSDLTPKAKEQETEECHWDNSENSEQVQFASLSLKRSAALSPFLPGVRSPFHALVWILYVCAFSVCFVVGPALYLIPIRPMWPNDGCIAFPMFGNRADFFLEVSSMPDMSKNKSDLWQYVSYSGRYNAQDFYKDREFILGSRLDSKVPGESERSQIKEAEWLSKKLGREVIVNVRPKAQLGYYETEDTVYKYQCNPSCVAMDAH